MRFVAHGILFSMIFNIYVGWLIEGKSNKTDEENNENEEKQKFERGL